MGVDAPGLTEAAHSIYLEEIGGDSRPNSFTCVAQVNEQGRGIIKILRPKGTRKER